MVELGGFSLQLPPAKFESCSKCFEQEFDIKSS